MRLPEAFRPRDGRPAVVGHRGVRSTHPENTLASIEEAARQGADAVEIDVRTCGSGEVVVLHDPDLWRVAGWAREAAALSLAQIRALDVGAGERAPTLAEVLALARDRGLGVNVELKHDVPDKPALAAAVARTAADFPRVPLVFSSFDPWLLALHRARAPRHAHALLVHRSWYRSVAFAVTHGLRLDGIHLEHGLASPLTRRAVGRRYLAAWTVNEPAEARRLAELGASAIITDAPARILAAFSR